METWVRAVFGQIVSFRFVFDPLGGGTPEGGLELESQNLSIPSLDEVDGFQCLCCMRPAKVIEAGRVPQKLFRFLFIQSDLRLRVFGISPDSPYRLPLLNDKCIVIIFLHSWCLEITSFKIRSFYRTLQPKRHNSRITDHRSLNIKRNLKVLGNPFVVGSYQKYICFEHNKYAIIW